MPVVLLNVVDLLNDIQLAVNLLILLVEAPSRILSLMRIPQRFGNLARLDMNIWLLSLVC